MEIHIHIDDRLIDAVKAVARPFTRRRLAALASLSVVVSSFVADAAPVEQLVEFEDGGTIFAEEINGNFEKLRQAIDRQFIRDDQVIEVSNCQSLMNELNDLQEVRILPGGSVTIEIASGEHNCTSEIEVNHIDGQRLSIVGAGNDPGDVTLHFSESGFLIHNSRVLGLLSNMTLEGSGSGGVGLRSYRGSSVTASDLELRDFAIGARVSFGADLSLTNCNAVGLYDPDVAGTDEGTGFFASDNATITLVDSSVQSFGDGIYAFESSTVGISGSGTIANNARSGIYAGRVSIVSISSSATVTYENNGPEGDDHQVSSLGSFIQG